MEQTQATETQQQTPKHFTDSTPLLERPDELRERAYADGYLFFKSLLPAPDVLAVRSDIIDVLDRHGWLKRGCDQMAGIADIGAIDETPDEAMRLDIGVSGAIYDDAQRLESMHRLPHHANLLKLYRTLFDREVLVHARHIARIVAPHRSMVPTPIHQDFPHIQGSTNTWTCWFPLGDCPRSMGSLTILRESHKNGYLPVQPAPGAGGIQSLLCEWENDWVEGDFEAGDVLTFPSFTVHKALAATDRDPIRISLDVRYQSVDDPVDPASLQPHCGLTWEEIYRDWKSGDLKYYWNDLPLTFSDFDPAYHQPGRRIC